MFRCFYQYSWTLTWTILCGLVLVGCASDEPPGHRAAPDPSIQGTMIWGEVRGERSPQIQSAIESDVLQLFPNLQWVHGQSERVDVALDLQVFSARIQDVSSTQEQRNCRRWSEPDRDAKGTLQRLMSRQCVDWQVQQIPCLTRTYEADAQIRARLKVSQRIIGSDRKVVQSSERQCGNERPNAAQLQAQAENQLAQWAVRMLREPLTRWSNGRIVSTTSGLAQSAKPSVTDATSSPKELPPAKPVVLEAPN